VSERGRGEREREFVSSLRFGHIIIMERYLRRGEVARILGVAELTLYRWTKEGKIRAVRTPGGEYRYPESEIYRILGEQKPQNKAVIYARVSSADQKEDLERQIEVLRKFAEKEGLEVLEVITEIASGLNGKRKGLKRLFELVKNREIEKVLITNKDRLTRFGYELMEEFFTMVLILFVFISSRRRLMSLWKISYCHIICGKAIRNEES